MAKIKSSRMRGWRTLPNPSSVIRGFSWALGLCVQEKEWSDWEVASLRLRNMVAFQGFYREPSWTLLNIYGSWHLSHVFLREAKRALWLSLGSVQRKRMRSPSECIWRTSDGQQHGRATARMTLVDTGVLIGTQPALLPSPFKLLEVLQHLKERQSLKHGKFYLLSSFMFRDQDIYYSKIMEPSQTWCNYICVLVCVHKTFLGKRARNCWRHLPQSSETEDLGRRGAIVFYCKCLCIA